MQSLQLLLHATMSQITAIVLSKRVVTHTNKSVTVGIHFVPNTRFLCVLSFTVMREGQRAMQYCSVSEAPTMAELFLTLPTKYMQVLISHDTA